MRKSILHSARMIVAEEGFRGLYGGFTSAVVGSLLSTAVYFTAYEGLKRQLLDLNMNETVTYLIAGGLGDTAASIFYVPSEVIKTRMQLQGRFNNPHSVSTHNYKSTWDALTLIYERQGLTGLYGGLGATLLRDVPFTALQFTFYETAKSWIVRNRCGGDESNLTIFHDMLSGGIAGFSAGAITTPLDVIKTYLQTQKRAPPPPRPRVAPFVDNTLPGARVAASKVMNTEPKPAPYYSGIRAAMSGIYKREGLTGLFSGIGPRMLWTGCQSIILFSLYENFLVGAREFAAWPFEER
ncbi:hypothetical protein HK104_001974 [Borealophlyctis nickersoniae]|nr:hypothetical protein HK104_001974 [Borealophlyctis nickersoniae]